MQKPTSLELAEYTSVTYAHVTAEGDALEDVLTPEYWSHVARRLKPGDKIEVTHEAGGYWALLMVRSVGTVDAGVAVLLAKKFDDGFSIEDLPTGYEIKWAGPKAMFRIIRNSDKEVVADKFDSKAKAARWMQNHMKAQAA